MPQLPAPAQLAASAAPSLPAALVVGAGERMRWQVRVGPFAGGSMEIGADPPRREDGRRVAVVRGRFSTSGLASLVDDRSSEDTTWLDLDAARPLRYRSVVSGDGARSIVVAHFHPRAVTMVERAADGAHRRARQSVPGSGPPLNLYAALLALRAWPERATGPATIDVWARSRLWRATVRAGGIETVASPLGKVPAHRIDGIAWRTHRDGTTDRDTSPRRFRLFVSADRDRLPLLLETDSRFGRVRVLLVEHRRPAAAVGRADGDGDR